MKFLWYNVLNSVGFKNSMGLCFCHLKTVISKEIFSVKIWSIAAKSTEKAMAPHSSTLAWKIPWMEEPGRLQSMGSLGVGYNWVTSLYVFTFMHWRRKWQPTPVFLPGESQELGSLVGCCLWGHRVGHDWSNLAASASSAAKSKAVEAHIEVLLKKTHNTVPHGLQI